MRDGKWIRPNECRLVPGLPHFCKEAGQFIWLLELDIPRRDAERAGSVVRSLPIRSEKHGYIGTATKNDKPVQVWNGFL